MTRPILALDLGQKTGWAVLASSGVTFSGVAEFRPGRFEGGGMPFLRFNRWLDNFPGITGSNDLVLFEEVRRHLGTAAAHQYGGFRSILTSWCEQNGIPYQGVPVGTIKRHITGKGNASKEEVIAAVRALGFNPADDNEADALALLHWGIANHGGNDDARLSRVPAV